MGSRLHNLISKARTEGLKEAAVYTAFRVFEELHDRRLGIRTWADRSAADLGFRESDLNGYGPAPYRALQKCFEYVPLRPGVDVFLDYGVGLGRAVVFAARHPFARVEGIDLSAEMVQGAQQNVARARPKLRCPVELAQADARTYAIRPDVTVFHFNNPFVGDVLASVVERMRQSLREHPREITVIYANYDPFEALALKDGWAERLYAGRFYPTMAYAVYRCRPRA